ncbi:MAG: hypothetical protein AB1776_01225 [Bacillota bacterium]
MAHSGVTGIPERIVEAYVGEYASGKSECAVNRAVELAGGGRRVTLVDLDIVEPCYTLRPIQEELRALGVDVIAWETRRTVGLGEAGTLLKPQARWALYRPGDVVFDVGYGVAGARTLNLVEGAAQSPDLVVLAVINASRPMTASVEDIVAHVRSLGRVDGLINNTHLAGETTPEVVQEGAKVVAAAARILGLPVVATTAVEEVARVLGSRDALGHPVRPLKRYMPRAFW